MTLYKRQGARPSPRKRNEKRQNGCLRRAYKQLRIKNDAKGKGEKERYTHLNAEFQIIARRDNKPSSVINAKKQRKTIAWERLEISSSKLELPREYFMQRWANAMQSTKTRPGADCGSDHELLITKFRFN